jgi:hypothetical protein
VCNGLRTDLNVCHPESVDDRIHETLDNYERVDGDAEGIAEVDRDLGESREKKEKTKCQ